jgi:hypothetical protein
MEFMKMKRGRANLTSGRIGWKSVVALVLVSFFGEILAAFEETNAKRPRVESGCWFGPVPEGIEPCHLIEQANAIVGRLSGPVKVHVQEIAAGLDVERSLRIQQSLLREHLVWLHDGLSERQLDLVVFLSVALSLERAQERTVELGSALEEEPEPKLHQRLQNVEFYRFQALLLLSHLSARLKDISDQKLRIW